MYYIKDNIIKEGSEIVIESEGYKTYYPTHDMILADGWTVYDGTPKLTLDDQLRDYMLEQYNARTDISDADALRRPLLVYEWSSYVGKALAAGQVVSHGERLWRVRQAVAVVLENQPPSLDTAALYEVIDLEATGTKDDPIAYTPPMEIFNGKYYTQGGVLYKCTRDSGQALSHDLAALVGLYVEIVPGDSGGGGDE